MHITSLQNPLVKTLMRLKSKAGQRRRAGLMLVEGLDEIELALAAGHTPRTLVGAPDLTRRAPTANSAEIVTVGRDVFEKLSNRENPDGWLGLFECPSASLDGLRLQENPLLVVLESVEKPGNLGAILRSADAVAVDAVFVCDEQADVYGPNVVRSSRGTLFSVPVIQVTSEEALTFLQKHGLKTVAATPGGETEYTAEHLSGPLAVAVGAESTGLSDFWLDHADARVKIPMLGKVNSLNVSVAAALLIYEALRQRAPTAGPAGG